MREPFARENVFQVSPGGGRFEPPTTWFQSMSVCENSKRGYWKYLLVIAIFEIGNSSNSFLILQTKSIGASFTLTILIYAGFNLAPALVSYPAGSSSDRWGRRNILLASFVIFFIANLGFARTRNVVASAVLFVFYGLFEGSL